MGGIEMQNISTAGLLPKAHTAHYLFEPLSLRQVLKTRNQVLLPSGLSARAQLHNYISLLTVSAVIGFINISFMKR